MKASGQQDLNSVVVAKEVAKLRVESRSAQRDRLRQVVMSLKAADEAVFSRQDDADIDLFQGLYGPHNLLEPPFNFDSLRRIYEESDSLQECVDAMVQNVDGFGWQPIFVGDDIKDKDNPEAIAEKIRMESFFNYVNDTQSFTTIRKLMRADLEILGNGAFEVVRNNSGKIQMIFWIPFQQVRASALDINAQTVPVMLMREGELIEVKVKKYFRKYASINLATGRQLRWFKHFGDPRVMDALTGEYTDNPKMVASELMHFKLPCGKGVYGYPRWSGSVLDVLGRRQAQYVNYDLFQSQGIPPMAILVSGGVLTDESYQELETLIRSMRGVERWNKILILESNLESVGMEEKGSSRIELKNLSEYRKEDAMFGQYLSMCEENIRHRYRLPPLYVGKAETFTHATAKAAQTVAEEQVFIPEREGFDEEITRSIVQGELGVYKWSFTTKGPRVVGADDITRGLRTFQGAGAMTVNHAIDLANRAFGLEMSKYDDEWASYPIEMVIELLKAGRLKGMEILDTGPVEVPAAPGKPIAGKPPAKTPLRVVKGQQKFALPVKVFKSDMFSEDEKKLYKKLLMIQNAVEVAAGRVDDQEEENAEEIAL